jgi:hypothetical protein
VATASHEPDEQAGTTQVVLAVATQAQSPASAQIWQMPAALQLPSLLPE